jgi:hypothetical protein
MKVLPFLFLFSTLVLNQTRELPIEVYENNICKYLTTRDLNQLRETCRRLRCLQGTAEQRMENGVMTRIERKASFPVDESIPRERVERYLWTAILKDRSEIVKLILRDKRIKITDGMFLKACYTGLVNIVSLVIDEKLIDSVPSESLAWAALHDQKEIARILIEKAGEDPSVNNYNAFYNAYRNYDIVKLFLDTLRNERFTRNETRLANCIGGFLFRKAVEHENEDLLRVVIDWVDLYNPSVWEHAMKSTNPNIRRMIMQMIDLSYDNYYFVYLLVKYRRFGLLFQSKISLEIIIRSLKRA